MSTAAYFWLTLPPAFAPVLFARFGVSKAYGGTIEELEDAQLQLQTLLSMRHVTPFRDIVQVRATFQDAELSFISICIHARFTVSFSCCPSLTSFLPGVLFTMFWVENQA